MRNAHVHPVFRPLLNSISAPVPSGRVVVVRLTDCDGLKYQWRLYRDARTPATWVLVDHTGYVRNLESTWAASVPRVKAIAENHGFALAQDLS